MQFSEDDLRAALKRKDPGPEFTQRVMVRLSETDVRTRTSASRRPLPFFWLMAFRFGPALGAVAIAVLLMIGAWIGYQSYQQHEREANIRKHQQEVEEERAKRQAILALRITGEKLNHVFRKVNGALPQDDKVRRQRL